MRCCHTVVTNQLKNQEQRKDRRSPLAGRCEVLPEIAPL
jgi:hypothetical protein